MPFTARYPGTCSKCGNAIKPGQAIGWSRRAERGKRVYHHDCTAPDALPADISGTPVDSDYDVVAETPETPAVETPSMPALPEDIASIVAAVLKAQGKSAPVTAAPLAPDVTTPARKRRLAVSSPWYDHLAAVMPILNRILLIGPPSSGKSTTAMLVGSVKYRITMTETTSREDLIGMYHLIDGSTKWVDGPITAAMRGGMSVLVDEIDRYSAECMSLFYGTIDDKPHVSLPNGEQVYAAPGYKVIMTSNETLETLPQAIQDRIECLVMANMPHSAAVADLPKAQQEIVMRYYKALPVPSVRLMPSVRRMRAFHKLISNAIPPDVAAVLVFGNAGAREILSAITSAEAGAR